MGVGLGAKKENGKLRGRLCHRSCSHASCLPYPAHLSDAGHGASGEEAAPCCHYNPAAP